MSLDFGSLFMAIGLGWCEAATQKSQYRVYYTIRREGKGQDQIEPKIHTNLYLQYLNKIWTNPQNSKLASKQNIWRGHNRKYK